MNEDIKREGDKIVKSINEIVFTIALLVWNAFFISVLWQWFMVPLGVRAVTVGWVIGLLCILGMLRLPQNSPIADDVSMIVFRVCRAPLLLLVAWTAKQWM